jgi:hypothetical protein
MNRLTLWSAVLASVTLLAAAPSFAQQGQGRGRGGFGGRGGGPAPQLMIPEVQKELKLEQAQIELLQGLQQRPQGQNGQRPDFRSMSPEEREKYFETRRAEQEKQVAQILKPEQVTRLKQLELQQAGIRVVDRSDVATALKLSADQRQKVDAALQAERESSRALFESFRNGGNQATPEQRQQAFQKMREARTATDAKLNAILTDAQKKQFQSMQGAPFTFPERRGGGRRNRGQNNSNTF